MKKMNPYCLLTVPLLKAMINQPMFFVRQYYERGIIENNDAVPLLISHYTHHEIDRERAYRHMRLLKKDPYRFFYDSRVSEHVERLIKAAEQPAGYRVYTNVLKQKWEASPALKRKVYAYMADQFPAIDLMSDPRINIRLQDLYGKLYLFLRWRSTSVEVLLDEVEAEETRNKIQETNKSQITNPKFQTRLT